MTRAINEGYFDWLCREAGALHHRNPHRTYWHLLKQLHLTPFRWTIRNDDNRAEDGKLLREEYLDWGIGDPDLPDAPASILEILVALSRRVAFESYGSPADWFWKLLSNLDMQHYTDANYDDFVEQDVGQALELFVSRKYGSDGRGGIFPLRYPRADQRRQELWYQMSAYILEGDDVANGP